METLPNGLTFITTVRPKTTVTVAAFVDYFISNYLCLLDSQQCETGIQFNVTMSVALSRRGNTAVFFYMRNLLVFFVRFFLFLLMHLTACSGVLSVCSVVSVGGGNVGMCIRDLRKTTVHLDTGDHTWNTMVESQCSTN